MPENEILAADGSFQRIEIVSGTCKVDFASPSGAEHADNLALVADYQPMPYGTDCPLPERPAIRFLEDLKQPNECGAIITGQIKTANRRCQKTVAI